MREILTLRSRLNEILAKHTGQSLETIARDTERDNFKSAFEAQATVWSTRSWSVVRMSRSRPVDRLHGAMEAPFLQGRAGLVSPRPCAISNRTPFSGWGNWVSEA